MYTSRHSWSKGNVTFAAWMLVLWWTWYWLSSFNVAVTFKGRQRTFWPQRPLCSCWQKPVSSSSSLYNINNVSVDDASCAFFYVDRQTHSSTLTLCSVSATCFNFSTSFRVLFLIRGSIFHRDRERRKQSVVSHVRIVCILQTHLHAPTPKHTRTHARTHTHTHTDQLHLAGSKGWS